MDRMTTLSEAISSLMDGKFSGYIKVNFSQGSIGRIEKSEELEETAIMVTEDPSAGKRKRGGSAAFREVIKTGSVMPMLLMLSVALAGCSASSMVKPGLTAGATDTGSMRTVQPGDVADIRYFCRLKSGEVAASTDSLAEGQLKSAIYEKRAEPGLVTITALKPAEAERSAEMPIAARTFDGEIQYQLEQAIVGMKQGERRTTELKAQDVVPRVAEQYIAHLNRVRQQPKVVVMPKHTYEYLTHKSPEVGQSYIHDPDFPGIVESISGENVTIKIIATPGTVKETRFGPGRISEEGDHYLMEIDAHKGALVLAAGMVGRISYVDDKAFYIDFANPFGGETLLCDVTVEKIASATLASKETATSALVTNESTTR